MEYIPIRVTIGSVDGNICAKIIWTVLSTFALQQINGSMVKQRCLYIAAIVDISVRYADMLTVLLVSQNIGSNGNLLCILVTIQP